jgi:hypothetical protein
MNSPQTLKMIGSLTLKQYLYYHCYRVRQRHAHTNTNTQTQTQREREMDRQTDRHPLDVAIKSCSESQQYSPHAPVLDAHGPEPGASRRTQGFHVHTVKGKGDGRNLILQRPHPAPQQVSFRTCLAHSPSLCSGSMLRMLLSLRL